MQFLKLSRKLTQFLSWMGPLSTFEKDGKRPSTDWRSMLDQDWDAWQRARAAAAGGTPVLIATSIGGHKALTPVESLLAVALTLRGAEVHFLLCDEFLPACMHATHDKIQDAEEYAARGPRSLCARCIAHGLGVYEPLGLPIQRYSAWVTEAERAQAAQVARSLAIENIPSYRLDGLAVGEHAYAGALRYYARGDLENVVAGAAVLRRYLHAALLTTFAMQRLIDRFGYKAACFNHGIYVPQGLIGEVCRLRGVRVSNWVTAYRKHCFIFSHDDTYHHTLMTEPTHVWEHMPWSAELEDQIMDYLKSRWYGSRDWVWFHERPQADLAAITAETGIDFTKPTIGLLTNVMWDAQLHYPANAFPNMLEWVLQTIAYFRSRPELQLVIRVHPAEIRGTVPSRQPIVDEIKKAFLVLPENVYVIPPESSVSTYALCLQCDSVLIYGTKTGVELTSFGIPVIVAGEAWIRNKGITLDASSADDYFRHLDRLPLGRRLDEVTQRRARMYAYHFFYRRMIPLHMVEPREGWPPYEVKMTRLDELRPGGDTGLDVICDGVLQGSPFIYPSESVALSRAAPARVKA